MKIGFYGNANNYPFMLALALQRLGHDIHFVVASRDALNRPENRYPQIRQPYPAWIQDLSSRFRWHFLVPGFGRQKLWSVLNECDLAVLNEEGPALAAGLSIPYIALLTGSDLGVFANPSQAHTLLLPALRRLPWIDAAARSLFAITPVNHWLTKPQRSGIRQAQLVGYFARGQVPSGDRLLDDIGVPASRRIFFLMADLELNPCSPPPQNPVVRIFCVARLTWKREPGSELVELDYKGTDIMLRGLALFHERHRIPVELRLARKGRHVEETAALVGRLGLDAQVTWLPELSQAEVRREYRDADLVFDQLDTAVVGMGGLEAMATGRPLIANARPEIIDPVIGDPSPVCQARNPEEVCQQLARLVTSPGERSRVGLASRRYVEKHFSADAFAARCLQRLGSARLDDA